MKNATSTNSTNQGNGAPSKRLDRYQIETVRGVMARYWHDAGHSTDVPNALCDMALLSLSETAPTKREATMQRQLEVQHAEILRLADRLRDLKAPGFDSPMHTNSAPVCVVDALDLHKIESDFLNAELTDDELDEQERRCGKD